MNEKKYCSLKDIRTDIDKIDKEIIELLAKRAKIVHSAAKFKTDTESVKAPERVKKMINERKKIAVKQGLNPIFIETLFKQIVTYFIDTEKIKWMIENDKFTTEQFEVIKADVSDSKEIHNLQIEAYQSEGIIYNDFALPPLTANEVDTEFAFQKETFLKIVFEKKIIGSIRAFEKDGTCFIGRAIVKPEFQGVGLGKKLMNAIEKYFEQCKRFELFTGNKSKRNIMLYKKLGYKIFKEEQVKIDLSLVYMEKFSVQ